MSNNMDDLFANVKKMVDSGNIPDDIKQMMNNLQNNTSNSNTNTTPNENNLNNILSQISPEMINNMNNILNTSNSNTSNTSTNNNSNNFNLDINTIMKMKSIMENMNNRNDPRANLLYSLKPYLRDSKKDKLDQYVNLLNVSKIAELMNKNNEDKRKN
mgnify:CR=1 FL=1